MQISIRLNTLSFLIGFNIFLYILPVILSFLMFSDTQSGYGLWLQLLGGFSTQLAVVQGEWWRAVTSNFLHIFNPLHLLANMFTLYQIGIIVYEYFGGKWLVNFYVLIGMAAVVASIPFLGGAGSVGASAAVFGLVGVLLGNSVRRNPYAVDLAFGLNDVLPLILFSVLINFVPGAAVGNAAHLAGLVFGCVCGYFVPHKLTAVRTKLWDVLEQGLFYFCILTLIVSFGFVVWNIISTISGL